MAKIGDNVDPQELQSFTKNVHPYFESLAAQPLIGWMLAATIYLVLLLATLVAVAFTVIWCLKAISEANAWAKFVIGAVVGASVGTLLLFVALSLYWAVENADDSERFYGISIAPVLGGGIGAIGGAIVAATVGTYYLEVITATDRGRVLIGILIGALAGTVTLVCLRTVHETSSEFFSFLQLENLYRDKAKLPRWNVLLLPCQSFLEILLYELPLLFRAGGIIGAIAGAIFSQF
ncbi:MAG: hypothetical protein KME45_19335 [Stenomitos rutilans HA7619-LM2]|jgi:MFS family permease|nr:hypothetical protein [Stenomitos rutilans HA7619-LM2]